MLSACKEAVQFFGSVIQDQGPVLKKVHEACMSTPWNSGAPNNEQRLCSHFVHCVVQLVAVGKQQALRAQHRSELRHRASTEVGGQKRRSEKLPDSRCS